MPSIDHTSHIPPAEAKPIFLRAYADPRARNIANSPRERRSPQNSPSDWTLIFDTETTIDESQQLRFGGFQLRKDDALKAKGIFFDPANVSEAEIEVMRQAARQSNAELMRVADFIERYLFQGAWEVGGTVVGFNLPFDLSRLAIDHDTARAMSRADGTVDRSMTGGFTFRLSGRSDRPRLRIKHLTRRAAFIGFAQPGKQMTPRHLRRKGVRRGAERGYFVDVKTLAAALTSTSHSLESLARFLGLEPKRDAGDLARPIDAAMVAYCAHDCELTWQCYREFMGRYSGHGLTQTPAHKIFSEASLGKAYLREMNIAPWREVQSHFSPEMTGAIMSSYFGGRAEVHIRREITQTLYCDFASMYPTVCTLMGLWRFVVAAGMEIEDATTETQSLLDEITLEQLRRPETWAKLPVLVQILPTEDILPVRCQYGSEPIATIGVNYLSSDRPMWFTLSDCIASKLLSGKAPHVLKAVRFRPGPVQQGLKPIAIAGGKVPVDPSSGDFYKSVIDFRFSKKSALSGER